eukprot:11785867-Alexandrium_andersonii.AAC.1
MDSRPTGIVTIKLPSFLPRRAESRCARESVLLASGLTRAAQHTACGMPGHGRLQTVVAPG